MLKQHGSQLNSSTVKSGAVRCACCHACSWFFLPLEPLPATLLRQHLKSQTQQSEMTKTKQGIHRHQTPPRYRNAASHPLPYGPLQPNMSSIKAEVHKSQHCPWMTEPRPQGICTQNFVKVGPAVPEICSQTDRQSERVCRV